MQGTCGTEPEPLRESEHGRRRCCDCRLLPQPHSLPEQGARDAMDAGGGRESGGQDVLKVEFDVRMLLFDGPRRCL
jgi:hypothetical protein